MGITEEYADAADEWVSEEADYQEDSVSDED